MAQTDVSALVGGRCDWMTLYSLENDRRCIHQVRPAFQVAVQDGRSHFKSRLVIFE